MKIKSRSSNLPPAMKYFMLQSALWTACCIATELFCHFVLHWGYPYNYPAVPRYALFGDFRFYVGKFAFFHSPKFFSSGPILTYPASTVAVFKLFLTPQPKRALGATLRFITVLLLVSWVMLAAFGHALLRRGLGWRNTISFLLATYLFSFAFWFEVHQGNIELVVWIVVTIGIWAFWTSTPRAAAVCFGIAGAMKIFPLVFLGLFLARKQYREILLALFTSVLVTVSALWLVCPDLPYSWHQSNAAVASLRSTYMLRLLPIESGFDHSLFVLIKRLFPTLPSPQQLGRILDGYLLAVALTGTFLFFSKIRKLPLINQVLALSVAAILFPPVSYDYTLIHLYAPLALLTFIAIENRPQSPRALVVAFSLLAFILSPQSEFIYHGLRIAGQLKSITLIALFFVALQCPFTHEKVESGFPDCLEPVNGGGRGIRTPVAR